MSDDADFKEAARLSRELRARGYVALLPGHHDVDTLAKYADAYAEEIVAAFARAIGRTDLVIEARTARTSRAHRILVRLWAPYWFAILVRSHGDMLPGPDMIGVLRATCDRLAGDAERTAAVHAAYMMGGTAAVRALVLRDLRRAPGDP